MRILVAGVKGIKSASHKTLNTITNDVEKLVAEADRLTIAHEITAAVRENRADVYLLLCDKYGLTDKVGVEIAANLDDGTMLTTDFDCSYVVDFFKSRGFDAYLSSNAGVTYGNLMYSAALTELERQGKPAAALLLHIPRIDRISSKRKFIGIVEAFIEHIERKGID